MSIRNWVNYLPGYLILEIAAQNGERFLNLALIRGVFLWDISRRSDGVIEAKMALRDLYVLRQLARQSRCRVRIKDKQGVPFWWRVARRRQLLAWGGVFFCLALWLLSNFIWVVEVQVEGELKNITKEQILKAAAIEGLKSGAWKLGLDVRNLEYGIGRHLPELAWIGISFIGTKAEIEVVEKIFPPEEDGSTATAHIVARKDGLVQEVLVLSGEARVKAGDMVRQGEVLISGIILPARKEEKTNSPAGQEASVPRLVKARGIVRARVWYEKTILASLVGSETRLTGREVTQIKLVANNKEIILKGPQGVPFASSQEEKKSFALPSWRDWSLPIELVVTTYRETHIRTFRMEPEHAGAVAGEKILKELKASLPPGARVLNERLLTLPAGQKDQVKIRVLLETLEDIGTVVLL